MPGALAASLATAFAGAPALLVVLAAGCAPPAPTGKEVVLLPYPDGGEVEWDGWAGGFVSDYCVQCHNPGAPCGGSNCHPSAGAIPDFRMKSGVVPLAGTIRCGISVDQDPDWDCGTTDPESFPVFQGNNPLPTDEQRDLVAAWIEAGCP